MTKIFEIISHNTFTIVVALLVIGFLLYTFMTIFEKEIKAFLKKKFELYDRFEVVDFARRYAEKYKGQKDSLYKVDQELTRYKNSHHGK